MKMSLPKISKDCIERSMADVGESLSEAATTAFDRLSILTGIRVLREPLPHPGTPDVTTLLVPGYKQTQAYTCGFVAGLMVLHALYPRSSTEAFYRRVLPDREMGTSNKKLLLALRCSGVGVSIQSRLGFAEIREAIDAGFPIITLLKTRSEEVLHWVVVYGYGIRTGKTSNRVFVAGNGLPFFNQPAIPWSRFCQMQSPLGFGFVCWGRK